MKEFEKISGSFKSKTGSEVKAYNAGMITQKKVLKNIMNSESDFYGISHEKCYMNIESPEGKKKQYMSQIYELLEVVFKEDAGTVIDLVIDDNSLVSGHEDEFVKTCSNIAKIHDKTIDWFEMKPSSTEVLLQVHDFISYAIGSHYEHGDRPEHHIHELYMIIESRIKGRK